MPSSLFLWKGNFTLIGIYIDNSFLENKLNILQSIYLGVGQIVNLKKQSFLNYYCPFLNIFNFVAKDFPYVFLSSSCTVLMLSFGKPDDKNRTSASRARPPRSSYQNWKLGLFLKVKRSLARAPSSDTSHVLAALISTFAPFLAGDGFIFQDLTTNI